MGDFNIHVDVATDRAAIKLNDILMMNDFTQHVKSPTHRRGHTLDLIVTRSAASVRVNPDPISDHSFVTATFKSIQHTSPKPLVDHVVRRWRSLDIEAFRRDLLDTELFVSPPDNVDGAFACYDDTLRCLLDKYPRAASRKQACTLV